LFEQFALEDARRRPNAKTLAFLKESNLVGVLASEIEFVGHDDNGVTIRRGKPPQRLQQINLRTNIEMQRGFIEEKKQRLLREGARQDDALLFAARDLIHKTVAEMLRADLGKRVARDEHVLFCFETQRTAIGMSALKNKFPGARGEEQRAFLLDHGDALAARSVRKRMCYEAVQKYAAGKRLESSRD
jgi:hypothetical protein